MLQWISFSLVVVIHLYNIYGLCTSCTRELRFARRNDWYEDFNLLELDDEHPIVSKVDGVTYFEETYSFGKEFLTVFLWLNSLASLNNTW